MPIYFSGEEIVEMGIKIEEMGELFYKAYAKKTKDEKIKELFEYLAKEETKHKETFQGFYDSMQKGEFSFAYSLDEEAGLYFQAIIESRIFTDSEAAIKLAESAETELEAINFALSFEKDTLIFYYEFIELTKENTKEIVQKLTDEEKKHIRQLFEIKSKI